MNDQGLVFQSLEIEVVFLRHRVYLRSKKLFTIGFYYLFQMVVIICLDWSHGDDLVKTEQMEDSEKEFEQDQKVHEETTFSENNFPNDKWEESLSRKTGINILSGALGTEEFDQRANSIHNKESIDFYKNVLKASRKVVNILSGGLEFNFLQTPTEYFDVNNMSANNHADFVSEELEKWLMERFSIF